jgi:uncharacterized protein
MSAEKETLGRVNHGLYHLQRGLAPFVEARMKAVRGANWLQYASRAQGSAPKSALDPYGLLKTMIDNWREVFNEAFSRNEKHRVRNFTSMALEARNATSHLSIPGVKVTLTLDVKAETPNGFSVSDVGVRARQRAPAQVQSRVDRV